ncbi:glycosyltransferase family 39 protein [Chlorobium sp. N1]|uniref:ArnT family glycosyltransferase n=1 Tax=Chlorobium sp. N1 TaxID=2491138 RepID=UPI0010402A4B|nr:glycosyltransferase family 39 protein [Chlorobium sp. N1]TCD48918.1 glycosyltransferase family 39 protein [Chlorobium sp. N1]
MQGSASAKRTFILLLVFTAVLYVVNFHINDIWTENESFYADAVRVMLQKGDFLNITYNGEPRFVKPPLTYWLMAGSASIFGLNEFALRLPVVVMAFWTVLLTWSMARMLYGDKAALYALAMQAIGIQFIAGKQYASPEIPLAFFFTLTLWLFLKSEKSGNGWYSTASAAALGLTVLTKGYPYFIVIGGIILSYIVIDSRLHGKEILRRIWRHRPISGAAIALAIGMSWVAVMYLTYGEAYLSVLSNETVERAFSYRADLLKDLLFYPEVILWSFFPYSLVFYYALIGTALQPFRLRNIAFPMAWFTVMLVIFTASKGKIPTYFIQAHPAMALLAAAWMSGVPAPSNRAAGVLWHAAFILPAAIGILLGAAMVYVFSLPWAFYAIPAIALALMLAPYTRSLSYAPFIGTFSALLIFSTGIMPQIETHRPIDQLGRAIGRLHIPDEVPIHLQTVNTKLYNLPFYAQREVIYQGSAANVPWQSPPVLALVKTADLPDSLRQYGIWSGDIYTARSSESRLMIFIRYHLKAQKGDKSGFTNFTAVYRKSGPSQ